MKKIISLFVVLTLMTTGVSMAFAGNGQDNSAKDKNAAPSNQSFLKGELIEGIIFTGTAALMIIAISASDDSTTTPAHHTPANH